MAPLAVVLFLVPLVLAAEKVVPDPISIGTYENSSVGVATAPDASNNNNSHSGSSIPKPEVAETVKTIPSEGVPTAGSDLLDATKLKFLTACEKDENKQICSAYRSLAAQLAERNETAESVNKFLNEETTQSSPVEAERFCDNLSPVLRAYSNHSNVGKLVSLQLGGLSREKICNIKCLTSQDDEDLTVKPLCQVLLWGYRQLLLDQQPGVKNLTAAQKAADVITPPLVPIAPIVEKKDATTKTNSDTEVNEAVIQKVPNPVSEKSNETKSKSDLETKKAMDVAGTGKEQQGSQEEENSHENTGVELYDTQTDPDEQNEKNMPDVIKTNDDSNEDYNQKNDESVVDSQQGTHKEKPLWEGNRLDQELLNSAEQIRSEQYKDPFFEDPDSNFFAYFMFAMFACVVCYVGYHNKSKLLALALEGRRSNGGGRGGFSKTGGRKHTAAYRKLDSNLEEAITSNSAGSNRSTSQIIY